MADTTTRDLRAELEALKEALEACRVVDFHERKQEFFCRVCRYRDPLVNGTKLHDDSCPWLEVVTIMESLLSALASQAPAPTEDRSGEESDYDAAMVFLDRYGVPPNRHAGGLVARIEAAITKASIVAGAASQAPAGWQPKESKTILEGLAGHQHIIMGGRIICGCAPPPAGSADGRSDEGK